jgi:hypothetical protein
LYTATFHESAIGREKEREMERKRERDGKKKRERWKIIIKKLLLL